MDFHIDLAFLTALASPAPTPGGGSAAAYAGAMAAALVTMVAQTTLGKKKYADIQTRMQQIALDAGAARTELEACVSLDANAFDQLLAANRAAKETSDLARVEQAKLHVTEVPLATAKTALHVLELAVEVAAEGNINALSDACAAASLANSTIFASLLNLKINAKSLDGNPSVSGLLAQAAEIEIQTQALMNQLPLIIQKRGDLG
ncbi:MAG: cyclodeaminase/cyclohydrolase family protein [Anaerolineae bacterium]